MNQDQLREVAADIQHELELARAGEGYEEAAVAEEIVDKLVAPLLATYGPERVAYLEARVGELHQTIGDQRAELERWRAGLRRHSWPTVESVPDGLQYAAALARAQGTEGGDEHDELLRQAAIRLRDLSDVARVLLADRARVEASRRDWAAEALRLEMATEANHCTGARSCPANVHHEGCFSSDTGFCCDNPQPIGDAGEPDENVITCANCGEDMDDDMLERLRYAPLPQCCVHPEGGDQ